MEEKFKIYNEQEDEKQEELLENNETENEELNDNTTIDEIAEVNEIKADDVLMQGQCLIIEKKTTMEV